MGIFDELRVARSSYALDPFRAAVLYPIRAMLRAQPSVVWL